jgi:sarcosine oxidase subunit gamma
MAKSAGRLALWLGPDEWLIIDESGDPMGDLAKATCCIRRSDVSHRNTAILVTARARGRRLKADVRRT